VSYPEKVLADDEQVVEHLHPHWITLVPATFWFLVICALAGVGIAFAPDHGAGRIAVFAVIIVVGLVLLSWLTFGPWIRWRTTHYVFTTHRVLIRRGVFKHVGRDIALQRINDVGFTQTLWERIVNAGTLSIESAGERGQEDLHDIPRSDDMQQLLNRLIEEDSDRRQSGAAGAAARAYQQQYPPQQYSQPYPPQQYPPGGPQQPYPTQQYPPSGPQ
jgi:uncharacterized membrane protein YdbT with pleckstrin-like domain